jgi:hypothetical protein
MSLEIPRHVHKRGGLGQGGESKVVSTLDELALAEADGWVVDPNAVPQLPEPVAVDYTENASSEAVVSVPDVLDDPDCAPPSDVSEDSESDASEAESDNTEPAKRRPGRPRKS